MDQFVANKSKCNYLTLFFFNCWSIINKKFFYSLSVKRLWATTQKILQMNIWSITTSLEFGRSRQQRQQQQQHDCFWMIRFLSFFLSFFFVSLLLWHSENKRRVKFCGPCVSRKGWKLEMKLKFLLDANSSKRCNYFVSAEFETREKKLFAFLCFSKTLLFKIYLFICSFGWDIVVEHTLQERLWVGILRGEELFYVMCPWTGTYRRCSIAEPTIA